MDRICFKIYKDWEGVLRDLDEKTFKKVMLNIFDYGFRAEENSVKKTSDITDVIMKLIKPTMKRDWDKFEERVNRNIDNGKKGGRPKKSDGLSNNVQLPVNEEVINTDNQKPIGIIKNPKNPLGYSETQKTQTISKIKDIRYKINDKEYKINDKEIKNNNIEEDKSSLSTEKDSADADSENLANFISVKKEKISITDIMDYWNKILVENNSDMHKIKSINEERKTKIRKRINDYSKEIFYETLDKATKSDFLNGKISNFMASFDWIICPRNFLKVYEGNYDNEDRGRRENGRHNNNSERALQVGQDLEEELFGEMEANRRV